MRTGRDDKNRTAGWCWALATGEGAGGVCRTCSPYCMVLTAMQGQKTRFPALVRWLVMGRENGHFSSDRLHSVACGWNNVYEDDKMYLFLGSHQLIFNDKNVVLSSTGPNLSSSRKTTTLSVTSFRITPYSFDSLRLRFCPTLLPLHVLHWPFTSAALLWEKSNNPGGSLSQRPSPEQLAPLHLPLGQHCLPHML